MEVIRKIIRTIVLALLIILALSGIGIFGFLPTHRERYMDNEIKIELVEEKKDDESDESSEIKVLE